MDKNKKLNTNARYLAKFKTRSIRLTPEEDKRMQDAAILAGQSNQAYILQAIRDRIAHDSNKA